MRMWIWIIWRWSLLVTVPVTCLLLYLGWATADRFYTFGVRYKHYSDLSLYNMGLLEFKHLMRLGELGLKGGSQKEDLNKGKIRNINLFVSEANIAKLNSNLPQSGFKYVKGGLWDGEKIRKVKIRYRGDSIYHWGSYKKSFRIKTKKSQLFDDMRALNLVAPRSAEILNNYLSFRLGSLLGLISPKVEVVNVSVNGKNNGVYILTEQIEELTLRNHNYMPGDIYSGELIGRDKYRGTNDWLFDNAALWEKIAVNNHYPTESKKPLEKLIQLVNAEPTEKIHEELSKLVDMDAFGRFNALEILTDTAHIDRFHNWRLYYDPMRGKFIPIVWDFVGWDWPIKDDRQPRLDVVTSPFHIMLHQNADFLRARDRALKDFFKADLDKTILTELTDLINTLQPYINHDPNLTPNLRVVTPVETIEAMSGLLKNRIENVFSDAYEGYCVNKKNDEFAIKNDTGIVALSISGRSLVQKVVFNYLKPFSQMISGQLTFWQDDEMQTIDISGAMSLQGKDIVLDLPLISSFIPEIITMKPVASYNNKLRVDSGYYEFRFEGISPENNLQEVKIDRGFGKPTNVLKVDTLKQKVFKGLFQIVKEKAAATPLIWSDNVEIRDVKHIHGDLYIQPGTTIGFHPKSSLIIKGRVIARGTSERPIRFIPYEKLQEPWGALALVGRGADDSKFKHVKFDGGSGLKDDLIEYTAMFSIHNAKGVDIENCEFSNSKVTDDMVHVVYSRVRFSNCRFENSLMDALDIDISNAVIERCHFINSGNDAIDLMTSTGVVLDTLIENGGDKAASVGEGSNLLAINNLFRNNAIGIQAKDGSIAVLYNIDLQGNDHALDAYKKNWRYNAGGNIFLHKSRIVDSGKIITADKKSMISADDCYIDQQVKTKKKRIKISDTVDSESRDKSKKTGFKHSDSEIRFMKKFDTKYWELINLQRRGASNVVSP